MPRTCTLCKHPQRDKLDRALLAGDSFRRDAQEVVRADTLLADVRTAEGRSERLYGAAESILERALEAAEHGTAGRIDLVSCPTRRPA